MQSIETNAPAARTADLQSDVSSDKERRFGGTARLWGAQGLNALQHKHAVVIGIGGVGSWAAECLARTGVGRLTLIDLDVVALSNVNRQIHALDSTLGANKTDVMAQRIANFAPQCEVTVVDDWIGPDNVAHLVPESADVVIDCIDQINPKTALVALCKTRQQSLIVCGAAGGKTDLSKLAVADLAHVTHDPLLANLRTRLRKQHGFVAAPQNNNTKAKAMGVACVYVAQAVAKPLHIEACDMASSPQGLSCAGYGSVMHMTASMGLRAAGWAIERLIEKP